MARSNKMISNMIENAESIMKLAEKIKTREDYEERCGVLRKNKIYTEQELKEYFFNKNDR